MRKIFAMCLCALIAGTPGVTQQLPSDRRGFRVDVDAVEVDVRVLDDGGQPVRGLTARDFELFEDGVRQPITAFTPIQVPTVPRGSLARPEPDIQSNRVPFDGRVYAIVLDDLHTHPLRTNRVKAMVRQFLDGYLAANDRAAIVAASGRREVVQDLTSSRVALAAALDRFQGQALRSSTLERIDAYYRLRDANALEDRQRIADPLEAERAHNARQALTTLRDVARWLDNVPARRKAILFVSEGIDYDIRNLVGDRFASGVLADVQDAIAGAARSNTSIYAVDPRGLATVDETIDVEGLPDDTSRTSEVGSAAFLDALRMTQDSLRTLSEETGGFAIVNSNDLRGGLERVAKENSEYYLLAYAPSNTRRDGRFRRIEVRVMRPGIHVVARRGYYARKVTERVADSSKPVASPLRALLESPIPVSGLPLDTSVAVFRGAKDGKASALVTIEMGPEVTLAERDGLHRGKVDVSIVAIDAGGKIAASERRGVDLNLRPATRDAVQRHGIRSSARLELKPGRYQIRVAAKDANGPAAGSVIHDVVVPTFDVAPLAVSDLVVASTAGAQTPATNVDAALKDSLRLPPTALREFDPSDGLTMLAEVYDNRKDNRGPITVTTVLTDDADRVAFRAEEQVDASTFEPLRRAYRHVVSTPLRDLSPGTYRLRVEVKARDTAGITVAREIPLLIRRHDS
jgi:VWFA-related protein